MITKRNCAEDAGSVTNKIVVDPHAGMFRVGKLQRSKIKDEFTTLVLGGRYERNLPLV